MMTVTEEARNKLLEIFLDNPDKAFRIELQDGVISVK